MPSSRTGQVCGSNSAVPSYASHKAVLARLILLLCTGVHRESTLILEMTDTRYRSRSPSPYSKRAERSSRQGEHPRSFSPRRGYSSPSSPRAGHHERSRSPRRRDHERSRKSGGGFRWKEKPRDDDQGRREDRKLERGYREHEPPKPRSPARDGGRRDDIESKFGPIRSGGLKAAEDMPEENPEKEKRKKKAAPTIQPTGEPMIIVNVNDRLGTKAAIPCLASDPISMSHV